MGFISMENFATKCPLRKMANVTALKERLCSSLQPRVCVSIVCCKTVRCSALSINSLLRINWAVPMTSGAQLARLVLGTQGHLKVILVQNFLAQIQTEFVRAHCTTIPSENACPNGYKHSTARHVHDFFPKVQLRFSLDAPFSGVAVPSSET